MPTAALAASAETLRTSDTLAVTLSAQGSAPLRVELPADLLDPASAQIWDIAPTGPATVSADGRTWEQSFRLSPFVPGESVPLKFNPITVNGEAVTPQPLTFKVDSIKDVTVADARPVTGIERPPDVPVAEPPLVPVALSLLAVLVAALLVVLLVARRRKPKLLSAGGWVRGMLAELSAERAAGRLGGVEYVTRLSGAVREYLRRRFGLDAHKQTTAELLAADPGWPADTREAVERLLGECDAVKYAGRVPDGAECDALMEQAGWLVEQWSGEEGTRKTPKPADERG